MLTHRRALLCAKTDFATPQLNTAIHAASSKKWKFRKCSTFFLVRSKYLRYITVEQHYRIQIQRREALVPPATSADIRGYAFNGMYTSPALLLHAFH